jgi:hypothetical protein
MRKFSSSLFLAVLIAALLGVLPASAQQVPSFPGNEQGWVHYSTRGNSVNPADTSCTGCVPPGAVGAATNAYVTGAGTPPQGSGSLQHATGDGVGGGGVTGRGGRLWSTVGDLNGVRLADIVEISYWTYRDASSPNTVLQTSINLYVDLGGDGNAYSFSFGAFPTTNSANDALLVFEPTYNSGTANLEDTWQKWTITQSSGLWWDVRNNAATNVPCGGPGGCQTLAQIVANYPNAVVYGGTPAQQAAPISGNTSVGAIFNGFLFSSGSSGGTPWENYLGNIDVVTFNVGGTNPFNITYDFELSGYVLAFNPNPPFATDDCLVDTTIVVEIRGAGGGSVVTGATNAVTLTLTSGTGIITGTLTQNAVAGVATFNDIQFVTPGVKQVTASATGFANVASASFNIAETPACAAPPPPPPPPPPAGGSTTTTTTAGARLTADGISALTTAGNGIGTPGANATWTYILTNVSGSTLNNVTARITYADDDMQGVSATSSIGANGTFSKGSLLVDYALGTLNAGQSVTLTIVTTLPNRSGIFTGLLVASVDGTPEANAILSVSTITRLPATGETPLWARLLRQALASVLALQALR